MGGEEDVWPVEVGPGATMADLKAAIEELYEIPQQAQRLATVDANGDAKDIEDSLLVSKLERQRVHLFPAPNPMEDMFLDGGQADVDGMAAGLEALLGAAQESMQVNAAIEESLRGVMYKVTFYRPEDSGGRAAGRSVALEVDALALVQDAQQMAELELFGAAGAEPAYPFFEGRPLPPQLPLFHAGIEDKKVVELRRTPPQQNESDRFPLQGMVGNGAQGQVVPPGFGYADSPFL